MPLDRPDLRHHRHRRRRHRHRHHRRVLGMAAHLEGKGVGIIDMAGLAQKGGAVYSHIRIANKPEDIHAIRVAARRGRPGARRRHRRRRQQEGARGGQAGSTAMVVNTAEIPARRFHPQCRFLAADRAAEARDRAPRPAPRRRHFVDASRLATALLGNSIGANIFMVGYAYQLGALPLSAESIEQAIELNGEAVAMNLAAFQLRPPRRARSGRGRGAGQAGAGSRERRAAAVANLRRDGRAARALSSPPIRTRPMRRAIERWSTR